MLVNAWANGNPECNENASEADQAKGNTTHFQVGWQHSRYEGVESEKLVRYISAGSHENGTGEVTHECDQCYSEFTNLCDNALGCAIGTCRDNPVVSPPNIEDTTDCL